MPMDLYRSGDHYVLHADLPGVDPDSVDVSVDGGILTVKAQRSERTEHDVQWLSCERFTGGYLRRLSLGQDIDAGRRRRHLSQRGADRNPPRGGKGQAAPHRDHPRGT